MEEKKVPVPRKTQQQQSKLDASKYQEYTKNCIKELYVKKPRKEARCQYVFESGPKIGERCAIAPKYISSKYCSTHSNIKKKKKIRRREKPRARVRV